MPYAGQHGSAEPSPAVLRDELLTVAQEWLADDPDERTREELATLVDRAREGDDDALAELADRFSGLLTFGTAGLRGALGAGPNRMNRDVVIRAAAGLTAHIGRALTDEGHDRPPFVVIGFDARHHSDVFARDTAAVVVGAGGRAAILPRPLPTPVLAFAIRHLGADAGVMVTASHNPAADNGYKVYLGDGCQIVPPADALIARAIGAVHRVGDVPRAEAGWSVLGEEIVADYLSAVTAVVRPDSPRDLTVAQTSLHGVGDEIVRAAFRRAGFPPLHTVVGQADPDPDFPTTPFPNPEEPGVMDAVLTLGAAVGADLAIAHDPDADRLAAAVPHGEGWVRFTGDEVGALLGAHVIARGVGPDTVFASSIVSSRLLAAMAADVGIRHEQTLTGFKWLARVPGLRFGYEEAIGYCVAPGVVRDKDGISAALLLAEQAAYLGAEGRTLLDVLDDLARRYGVYATDSYAVRSVDRSVTDALVGRLRAEPPAEVAGVAVTGVDDLADGLDGLPPSEGVRHWFSDGSRVVIRPSGTEPKLKVYLEVIEPVGDGDVTGARERASRRLAALRTAYKGLTDPSGAATLTSP